MQACVRWLAVAVVILGLAPTAPAGDNYAILVGVADYDEKELRPLKFTRADVLDFHAALLESGFAAKNVVLMHDDVEKLAAHYKQLGGDFRPKDYIPTGANVRKEVELMLGRLRADDSVIVALAGHGVQFKGDKKSYFCPSDAALNRKDSLIAFEEIFAALKDSSASRKLFLVDACQNDPQSEISRSRATIDLDSVTRPQTEQVPEGIIALFSCKAGQKSFELPELGHGIFFYHLLDAWKGKADANRDGKLSYQEIAIHTEKRTAEFAAVKLRVLQTPQLRTEFSGEWILRELDSIPPTDEATASTTPTKPVVSEKSATSLSSKLPMRSQAPAQSTTSPDLDQLEPGLRRITISNRSSKAIQVQYASDTGENVTVSIRRGGSTSVVTSEDVLRYTDVDGALLTKKLGKDSKAVDFYIVKDVNGDETIRASAQ